MSQTQFVKLHFLEEGRLPVYGVLIKETPQAYYVQDVIEWLPPYTIEEQVMAEERHPEMDRILVRSKNVRAYERNPLIYVEFLAELLTPDVEESQYGGAGE